MVNDLHIKIQKGELYDCDVVLAKTILRILESFDDLTGYSKYEDVDNSLTKMKDAFRWLSEASTSMTNDTLPAYVSNGLDLFSKRFTNLWV